MGILQAPSVLPAQVGVIGAIKYMVTTDNLATITTAGYMNNVDLGVYPLASTDILGVTYSFVISTGVGTFGFFNVSITNGVITLVAQASSGGVTLPVVSGDFANFNGTTGVIKDAGFSPTDATKAKVVMLNAAPTINHVAIFTNANGTVGDGGVLGTAAAKAATNNALADVASTAGSGFTIGHVVTAADTAGTIQDGGVLGTAAAKAASDNALSTVASTAGSGFTAGHVVTAADAAGSIQDSGIVGTNIVSKAAANTFSGVGSIILPKVNGTEAANAVTASGVAGLITTSALTTAGGASYAITWTNTVMTATSSVLLTLAGGTNTTKDITLEVVPGAGSATLTIYNNTAATALNGTVLVSYAVL